MGTRFPALTTAYGPALCAGIIVPGTLCGGSPGRLTRHLRFRRQRASDGTGGRRRACAGHVLTGAKPPKLADESALTQGDARTTRNPRWAICSLLPAIWCRSTLRGAR